MNLFNRWIKFILFSFFPRLYVVEFDSRGGTYDEQTEVTFEKQLYRDMLPKTIVGSLSKPNSRVAKITTHEAPTLDNTTVIWVSDIPRGDERRQTLRQAFEGMGTHGTVNTQAGQYPEYMSQKYRINTVKSPGFQIVGEEALKRVGHSIIDIPDDVRAGAIDWMAQEDNYDFIISLYYGGDKTVLDSLADGGLAASFGPGTGVGAGIPLCGMHQYTKDTGFITYDGSDLAAHNTAVNDAINGIDAADADKITLAQMASIRMKLDDLHYTPVTLNGKQYKAVAPCDQEIARRISYILKDDYKHGMERGKDNPIFNSDYQIEHENVLYFSVPDMKRFRPAYNAATGYIDIGPGLTSDPRSYTNSEVNASIFYLGAGAVLMGKDGKAKIRRATADYGPQDGAGISVHKRRSFVRSQWETKDGRTESKCFNVLHAAFYEPGIDW